MDKINWQNLPNTTTPITAENLNLEEANTETAINSVSTTAQTNLTNATKGYQTTQAGESFTLTDSAGVKGKIDVTNGKTEQATRDGEKNKIKNVAANTTTNGITYIINSDKTITINGTATANSILIPQNYNDSDLIPAGNYIMSIENTFNSADSFIRVEASTDKSTVAQRISIYGGATQMDLNLNQDSYLKISILIYNGSTENNLVVKPMLRLASVTDATYEPYGISPSPDYPSDIRNVGDNVNLLNIYDLYEIGYSTTKNGVTFTILANGGIKLNGTANANASIPLIGTYQSAVTKIKFDGDYVQSGLGDNIGMNYYLGSTLLGSFNNNITHQINSNCDYAILGVANGVTYNNVICYPKIEKGKKATGYSTYNNGSIDINTESKNKFVGWSRNIYTNSSNGARSSQTNSLSSDFCEIEPNTAYRMSGIATGNYGKNKYISYYDINKNYISRTGSSNVSQITQTTPANAYYCTLGLNSNFSSAEEMENFIADSSQIQLEKGTNRTSYQPYGKDLATFPFVNGQRLHNGDYLAEDGIHQVRGTFSFDGTESGFYFNEENVCVYKNIKTLNYKTNNDVRINCNRLKSAAKNVEGFNSVSSSAIYFKINGCTTLQEYKDKLAEWANAGVPLTFEDDYIEPVVIPYTAEQQEAYYKLKHLQMYEGYTEIQCIDEMKPSIKANYLYNNDINNTFGSIIDGLEERVHTLETSEVSE